MRLEHTPPRVSNAFASKPYIQIDKCTVVPFCINMWLTDFDLLWLAARLRLAQKPWEGNIFALLAFLYYESVSQEALTTPVHIKVSYVAYDYYCVRYINNLYQWSIYSTSKKGLESGAKTTWSGHQWLLIAIKAYCVTLWNICAYFPLFSNSFNSSVSVPKLWKHQAIVPLSKTGGTWKHRTIFFPLHVVSLTKTEVLQ